MIEFEDEIHHGVSHITNVNYDLLQIETFAIAKVYGPSSA